MAPLFTSARVKDAGKWSPSVGLWLALQRIQLEELQLQLLNNKLKNVCIYKKILIGI